MSEWTVGSFVRRGIWHDCIDIFTYVQCNVRIYAKFGWALRENFATAILVLFHRLLDKMSVFCRLVIADLYYTYIVLYIN